MTRPEARLKPSPGAGFRKTRPDPGPVLGRKLRRAVSAGGRVLRTTVTNRRCNSVVPVAVGVMPVRCNGCISAFQADRAGSIPVTGS